MKFPHIDFSKLFASIRAFFVKPKAVDNPTVQEVKPATVVPVVVSDAKPVDVSPPLIVQTITDKLFPHPPISSPTATATVPAGNGVSGTYVYPPKFTFTGFNQTPGINSYQAGVPTDHFVTMPTKQQGWTGFRFDLSENTGSVKGKVDITIKNSSGAVVASGHVDSFANGMDVSTDANDGEQFIVTVTSEFTSIYVADIYPYVNMNR